ncbi:MAG TPA: HPF/RaiA family ribosome-associated protein [Gemmatimonadaceae bacterium]
MPRARTHSDRRAPLGVSAGAQPRAARGSTGAEETPLTIRARGIELSDAMRDYVQSRAGFRLSRFARPIERVSVRFDRVRSIDASAPSIRCRIKVVVSRMQSVVAEATARTVTVAFGDALDASARWVNHLRERRRRRIRRRPPGAR